jgi:hypothetical protein
MGVDSLITKPAMKPTLGEMKHRREKEEEVIKKREQRVKEIVEEKRR